jgi:long-chain acyl-CoA synthetase
MSETKLTPDLSIPLYRLGGPDRYRHGHTGGVPDRRARSHPAGLHMVHVGYCDTDGYLHHVDRQSNVITMDGIRSYPEQMEHVLIAYPRVADVAVLGPRPELPAELTAVVQPLDWPASGELSDELTQFCDDRLPPPQAPIRIRFTEHLPRAATGKLYRNQIELP